MTTTPNSIVAVTKPGCPTSPNFLNTIQRSQLPAMMRIRGLFLTCVFIFGTVAPSALAQYVPTQRFQGPMRLPAFGGPRTLAATATSSANPITVPASTATGIALSATAVNKVGSDNTWVDYELVVIIATLNESAKISANVRKPMTSGEYVSIGNQLRTWLDGKAPQSPKFLAGDKAVALQYAIHSLVQFASSIPSGSALATSLGNVERIKFNRLQRGLDPNRQTPADVALYSMASNADELIANSIQEASDLAFNDPQYAAAINPLLTSLTGADTSKSYTEIQSLYPNALPALPPANNDGSFTLNSIDLMNQYQSLVAGTQAVIDNDLASLEIQNGVPPLAVSAAFTAQAGNASGPCSTASQKPPCWDDAQSGVTALSRFAGFIDPQIGTEISTVGNSVVKAGRAIDTLVQAGSALSLIGSLSPVGAIIGAAVDIFGLFGGSSSSSANAAVLQQIQKLSQQIARLQQDMDNRFNQVDAKLNTILTTLNKNFAQINYQLGVLVGDAHAIQAGLLDVETQLNQMEQYLLAWTTALSKEQLIQTMNACLRYRERTGTDIGFAQYANCENAFYTWAHDVALDQLWAGIVQADYTDASIYPTLLNFPSSVEVNYLSQFPAQNLLLPALTNTRIANPNEWMLGVLAYLELAHEWPQYAAQINSSRMDDLVHIGEAYRQAAQNASSIQTGSTFTANHPLFQGVEQKYSKAVDGLETALATEINTFTADPAKHLQGLDLWGGPNQTTSYVPAALSGGSFPACNSTSPAYTVPPNLVSLMSSVPRLAEQLNVGSLTICLSFSETEAFAGIPIAESGLGTYAINGFVGGTLVFSRTVHTLEGEVLGIAGFPCGPEQVWNKFIYPCDGSLSVNGISLITRTPVAAVGQPVLSQCWSLAAQYSPGNPLAGTSPPSPEFQRLIDSGYYFCRLRNWVFSNFQVSSLESVFVSSSDTVDTEPGITSVASGVANVLALDQQLLFKQIYTDFSATTALQNSGVFLTGPKLLLQAYVNLGLPDSLQNNDGLRSLLYGSQAIADAASVQSDFLSFSTSPVPDTTTNKITDEISAIRSRLSALSTTITAALNQVEQSQTPESWDQFDNTLAELQSLKAVKDSLGISPCHVEISPAVARVGLGGGGGAFSIQVADGCSWNASTNASWIAFTSKPAGTGKGAFTFAAAGAPDGSVKTGVILVGDQIVRVLQVPLTGIQTGDVTATISPATATINVGGSAAFSIVMTSSGGFSDQFAFSCVAPPQGVNCSFNPVNGPLPANGVLTSNLTITVSSKPSGVAADVRDTKRQWLFSGLNSFLPLPAIFLLWSGGMARRHGQRRRLSMMLAVLLLLGLVSCGGGKSLAPTPQPSPAAPNSTVTIVVQASSPSMTKVVGALHISVP